MFMQRIQHIRRSLEEKQLSAFFVTNFYNIFYLTGFRTLSPLEREAFVLVTKKNTFLFTDKRHDPKTDCIVRFISQTSPITDELQKIIKNENLRILGFEREDLRFGEYELFSKKLKAVRLISKKNLILRLREIKEKEEIEKIRNACGITTHCLEEIVKTIRVGQTEKEISIKLESCLCQKGYEVAFSPIVAVDENAAVPHYDTMMHGERRIKENSVVLIDFGAKYKEYCADMTRIFFIGKPKGEIQKIYQSLFKIQEDILESIKKLKTGRLIDSFCRKALQDARFPDLPHGTGHGVGLEVHEFPKVSQNSTDKIQINNVFTIEPGVYHTGRFGLRIEDTILVEDKKVEVLTKFSKRVITI